MENRKVEILRHHFGHPSSHWWQLQCPPGWSPGQELLGSGQGASTQHWPPLGHLLGAASASSASLQPLCATPRQQQPKWQRVIKWKWIPTWAQWTGVNIKAWQNFSHLILSRWHQISPLSMLFFFNLLNNEAATWLKWPLLDHIILIFRQG